MKKLLGIVPRSVLARVRAWLLLQACRRTNRAQGLVALADEAHALSETAPPQHSGKQLELSIYFGAQALREGARAQRLLDLAGRVLPFQEGQGSEATAPPASGRASVH